MAFFDFDRARDCWNYVFWDFAVEILSFEILSQIIDGSSSSLRCISYFDRGSNENAAFHMIPATNKFYMIGFCE